MNDSAVNTAVEAIIDRYVVERPWALSDPGYPQRELVLRFGSREVNIDAVKVGLPGISVAERRKIVAAVLRDFAAEVLATAHEVTK